MNKAAISARARLLIVGLLIVGAALLPRQAVSAQDTLSRNNSPWRTAVSAGPSFFWGAEGNTIGFQFELDFLRRVRQSPVWIRADLMMHYYGTQPVYPCLINVNQTCFSLMQRTIAGAAVGAQYTLKPLKQYPSITPYLLAGLATYGSLRVASQPPACRIGELCANVTARHHISSLDYGVQLGIGNTWTVGKQEFFLETKYHHRVIRDHKTDPFSSFRFSPISLGVRF